MSARQSPQCLTGRVGAKQGPSTQASIIYNDEAWAPSHARRSPGKDISCSTRSVGEAEGRGYEEEGTTAKNAKKASGRRGISECDA
jgi:hypothetical protein